MTASAERIIAMLGMRPHPEGGHYVETFREESDGADDNRRAAVTAIYFLLREGERSHWHRVTDATEIWAWHAGAPLVLGVGREEIVLGAELQAGERPQAVVPAGVWQSARTLGEWTLVSCVVAPGFLFDAFELAPPGFTP